MDKLYEVDRLKREKNHWWSKARRDMILRLIRAEDRSQKILDIGCAGGCLIEFLTDKHFNKIYGIDISKNAMYLCRKRKLKNTYFMNASNLRFVANKFDIIIASDVLEHIKNDNRALTEWYRVLKPNGKLIVFVPAFNRLWSGHDEINHHYRRYDKDELCAIMENNKFIVERSCYWNFVLFFFLCSIRILEYFTKKGNDHKKYYSPYRLPSIVNSVLFNTLRLENIIISHKINFPIGVSILVIAKKEGPK